MNKLRYFAALWTAKLSIIALKITGFKGTNFPGQIAIKICPEFLKYIGKPAKIIGITGTNGKTTVANMIVDAFKNDSIHPLNNNYGSNIDTGIATALIRGSGFFGKTGYQLAVLEIDERATPVILPYITPDIFLVTNLFRDSMKRNAHTEYIRDILEKNISDDSMMILNGDDLISAGLKPKNKRLYFGIAPMDEDLKECVNIINDARVCPNCYHKLEYKYIRYHHIGKAICNHCGLQSPANDIEGSNIDLDTMEMDVVYGDSREKYTLPSNGTHNIYNIVAASATLQAYGYSNKEAARLMAGIEVVSSRYSKEKVGEVFVANQMAKENNALGSSRAFDYVASQEGEKELILMMNCLGDAKSWSENTCWLYDCDFEFLNDSQIKHIIVTGPRGKDYHLRLLLAGVSEDKISWTENELDSPNLLKFNRGETVYVFFGTDSLELGKKVLEKVKNKAREASYEG